MPLKPQRPCRHAGCTQLTRDGYCPEHKPQQEACRSVEGQSWRWLYQTDMWRNDLRPAQLLHQPFCQSCAAKRIRTTATDVDHIKPHRGNQNVFQDSANLQSLCHSCHSQKTARELWEMRRGK